jgi:hypothetical protein
MEILTQAPLRSAPIITGTDDYLIEFPTVGVTHILEVCCKDHTGLWPNGSTIIIGFIAFDSHELVNGDYDHAEFTTFVPMLDGTGEPLTIKRNCGIPIAPPRTGKLVLRAASMPDCYISVHPNQETRPQACVFLPTR